MAKIDIIKEAENHLDPSILNGTLMLKGQSTTLKDYLEGVFLDALKEGSNYQSVLKFIDEYLMNKITPAKTTTREIFNYPEENVSYIDSFLNSHHVFTAAYPISKNEYQTVRDELLRKSAFMDNNHLFHIGNKTKTIEEMCEDMLNNSYSAPTIVDKAELSMFYVAQMQSSDNEVVNNALATDMGLEEPINTVDYLETVFPFELDDSLKATVLGRKLDVSDAIDLIMKRQVCRLNIQDIDPNVLNSYIDFGNGKKTKTSKYILDTLPKFMVSLFKVKFNSEDSEHEISDTIEKIIKNQRIAVELEQTKAQTTIIKANNRFTESADLPTIGIETVDGNIVARPVSTASKLDGITVSKSVSPSLTEEELEAAANIPDYSYLNDDEYFHINLDYMVDAIRASRTVEDLNKASKNLEQLIKSSYQLSISDNTEKYMSYATSLVETRRQELMKVESNIEDYTIVIKGALMEMYDHLDDVSTIAEQAEVYASLTRIEKELMRKNIKADEIDVLLTKVKNKVKANSIRVMILDDGLELENTHTMAA